MLWLCFSFIANHSSVIGHSLVHILSFSVRFEKLVFNCLTFLFITHFSQSLYEDSLFDSQFFSFVPSFFLNFNIFEHIKIILIWSTFVLKPINFVCHWAHHFYHLNLTVCLWVKYSVCSNLCIYFRHLFSLFSNYPCMT